MANEVSLRHTKVFLVRYVSHCITSVCLKGDWGGGHHKFTMAGSDAAKYGSWPTRDSSVGRAEDCSMK